MSIKKLISAYKSLFSMYGLFITSTKHVNSLCMCVNDSVKFSHVKCFYVMNISIQNLAFLEHVIMKF